MQSNTGGRFKLHFFLQAEDGIRDVAVTGVQTCALPISPIPSIATKMPVRQRTEATRTRRLKKADFLVDFFFIDGVKFSLCGEPETVAEMLGEIGRASCRERV